MQNMEPQVEHPQSLSIHISTETRSKRRHIKSKDSPPVKAKRSRTSDKLQDKHHTAQEEKLSPPQKPTSFRGLFSFARSSEPNATGAAVEKNPEQAGFQLLEQNESAAPAYNFFRRENSASQVAVGLDESAQISHPNVPPGIPHSRMNKSFGNRQAHYVKRNSRSRNADHPTFFGDFHWQNGAHGNDEYGDVYDDDGELEYADDEDEESENEEIERMAALFCRQQPVDELLESWSRDNGVRERMRRDFKTLRQNVSRGRKLGSFHQRQ